MTIVYTENYDNIHVVKGKKKDAIDRLTKDLMEEEGFSKSKAKKEVLSYFNFYETDIVQ